MSDAAPARPLFRVSLVPRASIAWLGVCGAFALVSIVVTPAILIQDGPDEIGPLLLPLFLMPLLTWFFYRSIRRSWATLTIGEVVEYRRRFGDVELTLPLRAVVDVHIDRPMRRIANPTTYSLRVRVASTRRLVALTFAEHYLFGAAKLALAQRISETLGVPLVDPSGERARASGFPTMGRGEEWKLGVTTIVLLFTLVLLGARYCRLG